MIPPAVGGHIGLAFFGRRTAHSRRPVSAADIAMYGQRYRDRVESYKALGHARRAALVCSASCRRHRSDQLRFTTRADSLQRGSQLHGSPLAVATPNLVSFAGDFPNVAEQPT